jgi:hypothetical protein
MQLNNFMKNKIISQFQKTWFSYSVVENEYLYYHSAFGIVILCKFVLFTIGLLWTSS